jgi:hypothetical protein
MEALEGTLINPQALKLCDFSIVTMVGKGSFGQVLQLSFLHLSLLLTGLALLQLANKHGRR